MTQPFESRTRRVAAIGDGCEGHNLGPGLRRDDDICVIAGAPFDFAQDRLSRDRGSGAFADVARALDSHWGLPPNVLIGGGNEDEILA